MSLRNFFYLPLFIVPTLFSQGCSSAGVETPSGFLQDYSDLKPGSYFAQEYVKDESAFLGVKTVKVAPVDLSHLIDKTACDSNELENLAGEFRQDIEGQLAKAGFTVTSNPSGQTLILSLALTNIEPPDALVNAGLKAASLFTIVPLPFDKDGVTAFEGKIIGGSTGKVLAEFAEKRTGSGDKISLSTLTIGNYTKFTNSKAVFSEWAQNIAKMLANLSSGEKPGTMDKASHQGKSLTKQAIGMVV